MKLNESHRNFFRKFTAIALSLLLAQPAFSQSTQNQQMVFEGSLTDSLGNPIDLSTASLTFYISANGCYLFGESSSDSGDSLGNISHRFGSGAQIAGSPNSFSQNLFFGSATGTLNFLGSACSVTASDTRVAQVYYPAQSITATIQLGTVPYSQNATLLSGKTVNDFVQVSANTNTIFSGGTSGQYLTKSASGLAWTNLNLTAAQVTTALGYTPSSGSASLTASAVVSALGYSPANNSDLTSLNAANITTGTLSSQRLPSFTGDVVSTAGSSTLTISSLRGIPLSVTPPSSNQVLTYSGGVWIPMPLPTGTSGISSITAGTGLLGGTIVSAGTLSVNFGSTSGTVASGDDPRIVQAVLRGNNLTDLTSPSIARTSLGLGSLATQSTVFLTTDVSGILPVANGGSQWVTNSNGHYITSRTAIGTLPASNAFLSIGGSLTAAPIKLLATPNLATPVSGAIEFDGTFLYITDSTNTRRTIATGANLNSLDYVTQINTSGNLTLNPTLGVIVSSTVASLNSNTGALVVKGGIGVTGAINAAGAISAAGTISTSSNIFAQGNITNNGFISTTSSLSGNSLYSPNIYGSTAANTNLIIESTSHTTKGHILLAPNGGFVGIGMTNPGYRLHVRSPGINTYSAGFAPSTGSSFYGVGEDGNDQMFSSYFDSAGTQKIQFIASGTNYINNNFVVGGVSDFNNSRFTVHGSTYLNGGVTVSRTLFLYGSNNSAPPIQFMGSALLATPSPATIEYNGSHLFYTDMFNHRRRLAGGVASGTIDNVNRISLAQGSLTLEGQSNSMTGAVIVGNLGAGGVALHSNANVSVAGSIKLSADGPNTATTCTAAEEGKQRYNSTYKTMEFCNGTHWNGLTGPTQCESSTSGYGSGVEYTLIGKPGTGAAFCMSKVNEFASFIDAAEDCTNRIASNGSRMQLCTNDDLMLACKQYNDFGALAESKLPSFKGRFYWTTNVYNTTTPPTYITIGFIQGVTNVCQNSYKDESTLSESSTANYRCCYK